MIFATNINVPVAPDDTMFPVAQAQEVNILPGDLNQQNNEGVSFVVIPPSTPPNATEEGHNGTSTASNSLSVNTASQVPIMPGSSISAISTLSSLGGTPPSPLSERVVINQPEEGQSVEGQPSNAHESDGESSDDDEEDPYWASFQEDTPTLSEEQLAVIAAKMDVKSAYDGNNACL